MKMRMRMLKWEVNKDGYEGRDEDEDEDKVVDEGDDQDERMDAYEDAEVNKDEYEDRDEDEAEREGEDKGVDEDEDAARVLRMSIRMSVWMRMRRQKRIRTTV